MTAIEPHEIYERTRKEGKRRLARPVLELAATALVGGFDVAFGVVAFGLAAGAAAVHFGHDAGRLAGSLAFGVGFVFVVVGRSELFTENFLVPIAGLDRRNRGSWLKLGELWLAALVLNLAGGVLLTLFLTSHGVLRRQAQTALVDVADHIARYDAVTAFLSAIVAGALMTLLTWFVEGAADSMVVRIVMAWAVGALIALGSFNHSIVSTIELVAGNRYGADVGIGQVFGNLGLAVAGNLVGGLGLVTFARFAQAVSGASTS
jgi:formate/nitrite transporter FocA (FNT family)